MFAIFKKELKSYFVSPIAYVLLSIFIIVSSLQFINWNIQSGYASFTENLLQMSIVLIIALPLLTMRIFAEDRKNKTDILLLTSPKSITNIVLNKFLGVFTFFMTMVITSLIYPVILMLFAKPHLPDIIGGYIAFILLGGTILAIGLFASSLTENQIIAAVIGILSIGILFVLGWIGNLFSGAFGTFLKWLSPIARFDSFSKGLFDLSAIVYYLSVIGFFLYLTIKIIERRRWSKG